MKRKPKEHQTSAEEMLIQTAMNTYHASDSEPYLHQFSGTLKQFTDELIRLFNIL